MTKSQGMILVTLVKSFFIMKSAKKTGGSWGNSSKLSGSAKSSSFLAPVIAATLFLGGCSSIRPQPLSTNEVNETSSAEIQRVRNHIEPLAGALTLDEAIARAIKYNLDRRVKMMEEAVANRRLDAGEYDLLPKLVAGAGYRDRNNDLITRSKDSVTGQPSQAHPYISSDRSALTTDLSFTWSLLDFGQSYYASKQNADRVLVAEERRRKAMHLLIQDVRTAFWRAASSQKLKARVEATIMEAEGALKEARQAEIERLRNPLDSLRYQRQLLENMRLLEAVDQELSTARIELASLTNLPMVGELKISEPDQEVIGRWLDVPVDQMEQQAIAQNADLREAFYNVRLATDEAKRGMLRLFPGLSFSYALRHSNDSYLINQNWNEAGVQISLNLLGLLGAPAQSRLGEAGIELAKNQRTATLMGVLTQVHLARLQLGNAYRQFQRADNIWRIDHSISEHVINREQAETQTKLDRVANQTSAILSELRRYQALAQVHAAASKLQATLGMEPTVAGSQDMSVGELAKVVGSSLREWDEGKAFGLESRPAEASSVTSAPLAPVVVPETEIAASLDRWKSAWQSRNVDDYLAAYSPAFAPADGSSREAWVAGRKRVIGKSAQIELELSGVKTLVQTASSAATSFVQRYRSSKFEDKVQKVIVWQKEGDRWLIVGENTAVSAK